MKEVTPVRTGWTIFLSVLVLTGSLLPGLGPCAARAVEAGGENADGVWMYAMSVGKADAILLSAGGHTALIDTGYAVSRGRVQAGLKQMGITRLDAVFVTHLDKDHIGGLTWLAESDLEIGAWYASAMYMNVESPKEHPMARAAALRGESPQAFMKRLANQHPQLKRMNLDDLQGSAQQLCKEKGVNPDDVAKDIDGVISPMLPK